jgi:hypothetical protein
MAARTESQLETQRAEPHNPPSLSIAQEYRRNHHRPFLRLVVMGDGG